MQTFWHSVHRVVAGLAFPKTFARRQIARTCKHFEHAPENVCTSTWSRNVSTSAQLRRRANVWRGARFRACGEVRTSCACTKRSHVARSWRVIRTPQDCGDVQTFCGMLKTFARRHTRQNVSFSRFTKRLHVGAMAATCKRSGDVPTCKRSDVPTSAPELGKCRRENVLFRHFVGTSSVGTSTLTSFRTHPPPRRQNV